MVNNPFKGKRVDPEVLEAEIKTRVAQEVEAVRTEVSNEVAELRSRIALVPGRTEEVRDLKPSEALAIDAVFRSINIIAGHISQMELEVVNRDGTLTDPRNIRGFLVNPNDDDDMPSFLEKTAVSLAASGNAYWLLQRNGSEATSPVVGIEVLNPHNVTVEKVNGRFIQYRYNPGDGYSPNVTYKSYQVKHLQFLRVPGRLTGLGPIEASQDRLLGLMDLQKYASAIFETGNFANIVISSPAIENHEDALAAKAALLEQGPGIKATSQGTTITNLYASSEDMQLIQNQQFYITRISMIFGIPPAKLLTAVDGGSKTYDNQQSANVEYMKDTLANYMREISSAFSALAPSTQKVRLNPDTLLRTDLKTLFESYKVAIDAGIMTAEEVANKLKQGGII